MVYWVFSRDVTAAMLVSPTNPPGLELYSCGNAFFCFGWKTCSLIKWVKTFYTTILCHTISPFCVTQSHHFSDHDEFGTKLSVYGEYLQWSHNKHDDVQGENDPSSFICGIKKSQYCSHHKGEEREGIHQIPRVTKVHTEFVTKVLGLFGSQLRNKQKIPWYWQTNIYKTPTKIFLQG